MSTDHELLELAAKAVGLYWQGDETSRYGHFMGLSIREDDNPSGYCWNPLTDDGDALRLAVALDMQVEYLDFTGNARARTRPRHTDQDWCVEYCMSNDMTKKDPCAATRLAITRAAAEVGRAAM